MSDLCLLSATEIARLIREGRVSSRDAVEAHIEQIRRVNPTLNAVVRTRFEEARSEALRADREIESGASNQLPPFHGVPCTIKEAFALSGMPQSSGLLARKHVVASKDATGVARLRAAGAIPLGVTNTSELCMWMESDNKVYGRTNNPYDPRRIAGGSSGGEGAIVSAGGSPFGLGSDVGGSIRGPAFFNGVFGHKPTGGLVPGTGQYPVAENEILRFLATGPIARRAEDLMPLLGVLAGPDGLDAGCFEQPLGEIEDVQLEGRALYNVEDNGEIEVSADLRAAQLEALDALEARGMRVHHVRFESLKRQFDIWSAMMHEARETSFTELLGQGKRVRPVLELLKSALHASDYTLIANLLAVGDRVPALVPKLYHRMAVLGRSLRRQMSDLLGEGGVLLYPSHDSPAPLHGEPVRQALRLRMPWAYLAIMNVLELPSTQVPLGLNPAGLPLGVQVVSRHGNDHVTIRVALELERAFGGWAPPPLARLDTTLASA